MRSKKIRSKKNRKTYKNLKTYNNRRTKKIGKRNKKTKKTKKRKKKTKKIIQRGGAPKKCLYCNSVFYSWHVGNHGWWDSTARGATYLGDKGSPSNIICPTCYSKIKSENMYNDKSDWILKVENGKRIYVNEKTKERQTEVPEEGSKIDYASFQTGSSAPRGQTMEEQVKSEMAGWSGETKAEESRRLKEERKARQQRATEDWEKLPYGHDLGSGRRVLFSEDVSLGEDI
tara:strand:- start:277 stop:966 length:690 start_codon:yes stop_codon:yes gene_type:complete